ncbi:hypothetical protein [Ruminiclostridium cellobioparum]|uniref:Cyclic nucleotide-binding domain-containing protein n=1 Tax=Ruminiclostridium cellobioparum subsp. termitidis CT1112 TaxID=1195236 RepID=S0FQT6_RUMCE|nr:hypothetical protein [Ruminiclostridium cellobioparum]EMS74202.1 hypothetical protein CTER_0051 [Ruminiclostridium cellobioparum subsp. termitidis CT1112]
MSIKPDFAGQYSSIQGELLICEGDRTSSVVLLLKGKIDVFLSPFDDIFNNNELLISRSCRLFTLEQNTFLSINDVIRNGQNSFSLLARDACTLYCFPANSSAEIRNIISTQKDYSAYLVSSLANLIDLSYNSYQKLLPICHNINALTQNLMTYYWAIKDKFYFSYAPDMEILNSYQSIYENLKQDGYRFFPLDPDFAFTHDMADTITDSPELDTSSIEYFTRLLNVPLDNRKTFFNSDSFICEYHIQKGSEVLDTIIGEIKNIFSILCKNMELLYLSPNNLLTTYGRIATDSRDDKEAALNILNILTQAIDITSQCIDKLQNEFDSFTNIDIKEFSDLIESVRAKTAIGTSSTNPADIAAGSELPSELENSLEKIMKYCSCPQDKIDSLNKRLSQFRALKDKTSADPEIRELRSSIANDFFVIYDEAFKRTQADNSCPKLISMFLNFGYMDERLVTKQQAIALYRLCDKEYSCSDFNVYNTKKWLELIHNNKKEPSINDFGQDYSDVFRDMKKRKIVSDADKPAYDRDFKAKVSFEVNNMLKTNQKVCHGHMSSYFPILHKDIITRDLEKAVVTPTRLQQAINNLLAIDFSIFYREIWYKNDVRGIEKEPIMKEIRPDIIIVPTFGSRVSMWQEITGKARNTPGRFIVPAFTDENLSELMIKLIGAFRWELCRTMMGVAWNDITEKSLTSEYTDYIQFFKKNHDLTEDAKEKIKIQIQKNRNVMREIFTSDYETWINYESKGILRLNKLARSILFRYCPPPREMRNALAKQPAFTDLLTQFNNSRAKTAKSLTGKYTKLFKNDPIDRDMELNLIYYRDL